MTEEADKVTVTFTYGVQVVPATETKVTYEVTGDGKIRVKAHYFGKEGLPGLPLFGMRFRLLSDADRFTYYGYGPEENYIAHGQPVPVPETSGMREQDRGKMAESGGQTGEGTEVLGGRKTL